MKKMKSKMVKSIMMLLALASSNYSYASSFLFRLRHSISNIHTCQNAAGTCQEVRSYLFV